MKRERYISYHMTSYVYNNTPPVEPNPHHLLPTTHINQHNNNDNNNKRPIKDLRLYFVYNTKKKKQCPPTGFDIFIFRRKPKVDKGKLREWVQPGRLLQSIHSTHTHHEQNVRILNMYHSYHTILRIYYSQGLLSSWRQQIEEEEEEDIDARRVPSTHSHTSFIIIIILSFVGEQTNTDRQNDYYYL